MTACRYVARTMPRLVCHERHERGEWCESCSPCPDAHCRVCGITHVDHTCGSCLDEARTNIAEIRRMVADLLDDEAETRGPTSEATMLLGPVANPEARGHLEASVACGRVHPDYLGEMVGEEHPLWVLGTWEMVYRDAFDHETAEELTIGTAGDYLDRNLTYASAWPHVPFEDFARDLRRCASHLESVLHDRDHLGAPCLKCGTGMVRAVDAKGATTDDWWCEHCKTLTPANQYRFAVTAAYRDKADRLTAKDLAERLGVPASTVRRWASIRRIVTPGTTVDGVFVPGTIIETPPLLRWCGRDPYSRKVYRVADAEALRDRLAEGTTRAAC